MNVLETSSGIQRPVEVIPLEDADYKTLTKSRYFFDWKIE
jgi:hypothetical protein